MSLRFETTKELAVPDRLSLYGTDPGLVEAFFEPVEHLDARLAFLIFATHAVRVKNGVEVGWIIEADCFDYDSGDFEEVGAAWIHGKQEDRPEILGTVGNWIQKSEDGIWLPEQIVELPPVNPHRSEIEIKGMILARANSDQD